MRCVLAASAFAAAIAAMSAPSAMAMPRGFAAAGSVLPDDPLHWPYSRKAFGPTGLREYIIEEMMGREKWGVTPTDEEEDRGYVVFSRHYCDPTFWFSLPNNRAGKLSMFLSLGEYEPTSFSVYAIKETEGLSATATDLTGPGGAVIKRDNIEIRMARDFPSRYRLGIAMVPKFLERRASIRMAGETAKQFWVTVYAPENARPGKYAGTINLRAPGRKPASVKLEVEVLPIHLREAPTLYMMCFLLPNHPELYPGNLDKCMVDMREHGMNSMWTWPDADVKKVGEKYVWDFTKWGVCRQSDNYFAHSLTTIVESYMRAGFTRPWLFGSMDAFRDVIQVKLGFKPFTPEFDAVYLDALRQYLALAKTKHWPPIAGVQLVDEPGGRDEGMVYAKYYNKLVKDNFPDIKIMEDVGPWRGEDEILDPWVDIMCYGVESAARAERCRKAGDDYWMYNGSSFGHNPALDRLYWGLHGWKAGVKGIGQWVYTWWWELIVPADEKTYVDPGFMYVKPAVDGPVPTRAWEGVREGIDDTRYAFTLQELIKQARASDKPAAVAEADRAQRAYDDVLADMSYEHSGREPYLESHPSPVFDAKRRQLADAIERLQAKL